MNGHKSSLEILKNEVPKVSVLGLETNPILNLKERYL